jgi:hypothetical protein
MSLRDILRNANRIDRGVIMTALLTLFAIQPLLKPGLPTTADLAIHIYRALEFERAWAPGVVVPRWSPNLAYGYGYPLFVFAPPLPYLLALLFQLTGATIGDAFKALIILTILLYAIGMYLFARQTFDCLEAGLIAAIAYTFAPFALREAILYGGNIPQYLAIGLFPWSLWAIRQAIQRGSWGWMILGAIFYAGVILSHLFQVLIFTPVLVLYILLLLVLHQAKRDDTTPGWPDRLRQALPAPGALALGLLLSAFFWLPAFLERSFTRAEAHIYLEKSPFFVRYPHWSELVAWIQPLDFRAANPYVPLSLGLVTLGLAGLGLSAGLLINFKEKSRAELQPASSPRQRLALTIFFALIAAGAVVMALPLSRPAWELVEILQVAEFPWRMLGLANLGLALLAGAAILWLPQRFRRLATGSCIALQLLAVAPLLFPVTPFTQYGHLTLADQINYERRSQSIGTTTLGEYLPRGVSRPPTTSPLAPAFQANTNPERLDRDSLPAKTRATLLEQTAVTHRYQLDSPTPFTLRFFHFDYPGWRATLDGQAIPITPEPETGLMLMDIPGGQHTLTLHFGETPGRLTGLILSGVTIVSLLVLTLIKLPDLPAFKNLAGLQSMTTVNPGSRPALSTPATFMAIIIAAFWLKPLLQPIFTIASPRERALPAQHATDIRFANGIQLIGYDLKHPVARPGGYLQVVLYWQTDQAPYRVNLQPFVHLDRLDNFTTIADATNYTPGDVTTESNLPTFHWDNTRYIRDEHDLTIPSDTPPLAYAVRVGLIDPGQAGKLVALADGSGDTAWLATINVSPTRNSPPVALAQALDVLFSNRVDTIQLTGFEATHLSPERLEFRLTWQSRRSPRLNYTVFAQLLDSNHKLVASFDRPPLDGAYPTSTWLPNQPILDPRYIPLTGVPTGDYTLIVGLYDPATGQRLITNDGADFAKLTTITIQQP